MPESTPSIDAGTAQRRQQLHDLRNAVNTAGLCLHAARQLLRAGRADKAEENLARADIALERARHLLAPSADGL